VPDSEKVGFYGLDLYSLRSSIQAVLGYLEKVDPASARRVRARYSCFDHFGEDSQTYGLVASLGMSPSCEDEAVNELTELRLREAQYLQRDGRVAGEEQEELARRERAYRGHDGAPNLYGKTVILVDDGLATGSTIRTAVRAVRQQRAARIIVAVPTAAPASYAHLTFEADEVIALMTPENFHAVSQWYEDFSQTSDAEVTAVLAKAAQTSILKQAA
jgi:predicted phosphoribosyltransferase